MITHVRCLDNTRAQSQLTLNKIYLVTKDDSQRDSSYTVITDTGNALLYICNRFLVIKTDAVEEQGDGFLTP